MYTRTLFSPRQKLLLWLLYWPVLYPEESNSLRERGNKNVGLFHWPPISTENLHADTTSSDKFLSRSLVLNLLRLFCFSADLPFTLCHEIDLIKEGEKLYCIFF